MDTDIVSLVQNMDLGSPTWDLFLVLFFIMGAFIYGFSLGRDRIIVILVSVYMSLAVVDKIPIINHQAEIALSDVFAFKITSFFVLFLFLFFFFARSGLLRTIAVGDNRGRWYQVVVFSILQIGLIISIAMSFLPADFLAKFSGQIRGLFNSEAAQFFWLVAPLLAMAMIRRPDDKKK
jgi:hypothetical protein